MISEGTHEHVCEQLREPERRITRNFKSTSTAAARLRRSFSRPCGRLNGPRASLWLLGRKAAEQLAGADGFVHERVRYLAAAQLAARYLANRWTAGWHP